MGETDEHKEIKQLITSKLKEWFGFSIEEFPEAGHELDVFGITLKGIRIYVEIIWSNTQAHFLEDLLSVEHAPTHIKIVIANPKIIANDRNRRKYGKTVAKQLSLGIRINGEMLSTELFLKNSHYIDSDFKELMEEYVASLDPNQAKFEPMMFEGFGNQERTLDAYISDLIFQYENFSTERQTVIQQLSEFNFYRYYIPVRVQDLKNRLTGESNDVIKRWLKNDLNGLFIIGDFGSGKSTLCIQLAYTLAFEYKKTPGARAPVFIPLRDIEEISQKSLLTQVNKLFKVSSWKELAQLSASGKLVFILDGFDEIPKRTDWKKTLMDFQNIVQLFCKGQSKVIVSCRTHFFKKDSEIWGEDTELMQSLRAAEDFSIVATVPFEESQITELIKRHFSNWEEIWKKIRNTYNLKDLSTRPLLTEMIISTLHKVVSLGGAINEVILYDKYTEDWINHENWRSQLNSFQKALLMEHLAFKLFLTEQYSIQFGEIRRTIEDEFGVKEESIVSDYYDYDIRTCSFFRRDSEGNYSFMHRSFLEFFVAKKIARDLNQKDFSNLGKRLLTNEIVFFLHKLLNPSVESLLLQAIRSTKNGALTEFGFLGGNALQILNRLGKNQFINQDFSFCCIQGISVTCNFKDCNLNSIKFNDVRFEGSEFTNCSFLGVEPLSLVFESCSLQHIQMKNALLTDCEFNSTKVHDIVLSQTTFKKCRFNNVSFCNGSFEVVTFSECNCNHSNKGSINFSDITLINSKFINSQLICGTYSNVKGTNLEYLGCDVSGTGYRDIFFQDSIFKNSIFSFCSFVDCENSNCLYELSRFYKVFSTDNLSNWKIGKSMIEISTESNHTLFKSTIKPKLNISYFCELDKAAIHFNVDNFLELEMLNQYLVFSEHLKTYGKSTTMATACYSTLKNTCHPQSLRAVAREFDCSVRGLAANYRKLLSGGYLKHVSVSPKQLIGIYAKELTISQESQALAQDIFESAKKNHLPQGRDSATYASACLSLACKKKAEKVTLKAIAATANITTVAIRYAKKTIENYYNKLLI